MRIDESRSDDATCGIEKNGNVAIRREQVGSGPDALDASVGDENGSVVDRRVVDGRVVSGGEWSSCVGRVG